MKFNNFKIKLLFRIFFICLNAAILGRYFDAPWLVVVLMTLVFIIQVWWLFIYLDKPHRDLQKLFEAIRYDDFSFSFSRKENDPHLDKLYQAFNDVLSAFRTLRTKSEEYKHFLQTVVQHVGIPLLAFDSNGKVELLNNATKKFLKLNRIKYLSDLQQEHGSLSTMLSDLKNGEKKNFKMITEDGSVVLSLFSAEFIIEGKPIKLVTFVNITRELDEKELESWLSLLKVLTHEIMNSMTPISSLSSSVRELLSDHTIDDKDKIEQIHPAIETIERRSMGMIGFIGSFRSLTALPRPAFKLIHLSDLFSEIESCFKQAFIDKKIHFIASVFPATLQITADNQLIMQVLLNLVQNSIEAIALQSTPRIIISGHMSDDGFISISVEDNGGGILPEVQEKVFIPFFTTSKTGSGIGLSLSKLIMQAHKGTIKLESVPEKGTKVILAFC